MKQELFELLRVWHFLKTGVYVWPEAVHALEHRLNEILATDEWQVFTPNEISAARHQ